MVRQEGNWDCLGQPSGKYNYLVKYNAPTSSHIDINTIQPSGWGDVPSDNNDKAVEAIENLPNTKKKVTEDLTIKDKATEGLDPDQMKTSDVASCVNTMGPFSEEVTRIKAEAVKGPMKLVTSGILHRIMEDPKRSWNKCCCKHSPKNMSWCCCPEKEFDQIPRGVEVEEERLIKKMNESSIADERNVGVNMVEVSQRDQTEVGEDRRRKEYQRLAYPKEEENLVEFIKRCQKMRTEVMLCPRCSAIFDRKATTNLEAVDKAKRKENWGTTGYDPRKSDHHQWRRGERHHSTYKPSNKATDDKWVQPIRDAQGQKKWRNFEVQRGTSMEGKKEVEKHKPRPYPSENYKGKNPMSRSQWRRFQRQKRTEKEAAEKSVIRKDADSKDKAESSDNAQMVNREEPSHQINPGSMVAPVVSKEKVQEDDEITDNFESDSEASFNVICNVVSVLPRDYDRIMEVEDEEDEMEEETMVHRPVCYYVMNNGCVEEQNAFFERPDDSMKAHLKPLFIKGKVENVGVNKILVDGGAAVNLMPHFMLKKIGKDDSDAKPHNMVLSNYEGKVGTTMGVIQVNLTVGTITRPTMFMVIASRANYNLLLGREWIHGVGAVPSSMHQRIAIWRPDGIVENIEADQSYFMTEVNNVNSGSFDKNLAHIPPCSPAEFDLKAKDNAYCSMYLHPTHGFQWDKEVIGESNYMWGTTHIAPTRWGSEFDDDD
jgi:hypothetical protein